MRISTTNLLCSLCLANIRPSSNLMRCKWCSFFSYLLFYCRAFFMNPDPDFSDPDLDSGKKRSGAGQKDPDPKHWFWWGAHDKDFSFGGIFSFILIAIFHNYYFKLMKTGVFSSSSMYMYYMFSCEALILLLLLFLLPLIFSLGRQRSPSPPPSKN